MLIRLCNNTFSVKKSSKIIIIFVIVALIILSIFLFFSISSQPEYFEITHEMEITNDTNSIEYYEIDFFIEAKKQ